MGSSFVAPEEEVLATGWEPELDPADSLVRQAVLAHASWAVDAARRAKQPWYDGPSWAGGILGDRNAFTNWIVLKQPTDPAQVIAEVARELDATRVPYLFVSPWPTGDLRPHGLALAGHPPLMVRLPSTPTNPPSTDLDVRHVTDADGLADAERVLVEGYPLPELQPFTPGSVYHPSFLEGSEVWVGYDGTTPLATATAHHAAGLTVVENVAVLPAARGRGAGATLTWAATTHHPHTPAALIASDEGQPVYTRLGYLRLERWTVWVHP